MELKKLGVMGIVSDWKRVAKTSSKTTLFIAGFAFALILFSVFLAFNNPNPIEQPQSLLSFLYPDTEKSTFRSESFLNGTENGQVDSVDAGKGYPEVDSKPQISDPEVNKTGIDAELGPVKNSSLESDREIPKSGASLDGKNRSGSQITQPVVDENSSSKNKGLASSGAEKNNGSSNSSSDVSEQTANSDLPQNEQNHTVDLPQNDQNHTADLPPNHTFPQVTTKSGKPEEISSNKSTGGESSEQKKKRKKKKKKKKNLPPDSPSGSVNPKNNETVGVKNTSSVVQDLRLSSSNGSSVGVEGILQVDANCDLFHGKWVPDDSRPLYAAGSCPYIDESFNCFRNRRPDNLYERWRWQPHGCDIPRLNAKDMLERLRHKRLAFVGDSLNRNMWESLVCILREAVPDKSHVYEISGKKQFRKEGFYAFHYEEYNCSIEFVRAPFLVQEWEVDGDNGTKKETLRLDLIETSLSKIKEADIVIFNTGHWWTHEKTSKGKDYYQEGDHVYSDLNVLDAYRKALKTWANWVDSNLDPTRTHSFFRGYSATHFSGGQWNSGGQCHKEVEPIFNDSYIQSYPSKMVVLESVLKEMNHPVSYLNITTMTDYRKDAHPSVYRRQYLSQQERIKSERYQDCSHWCLPGVPDVWNELLYAFLLMKGKGS